MFSSMIYVDMSQEEFTSSMGIHNAERRKKIGNDENETISDNIPQSIDWTNYKNKSYVTPVKNQASCPSAAFCVTGAIESRYAIANGTLNSLSEQQLIDCTNSSSGNEGCVGGGWSGNDIPNMIEYTATNGGLCSENDYPYISAVGTCNIPPGSTILDPIQGYSTIQKDSESALQAAVAAGPVSYVYKM